MKNTTYPFCTSETLKKDISELCARCPLKTKIQEKINSQIIVEAIAFKEISTYEQFQKYCEKEIANAQASMQRQIREENQGFSGRYRKTRIELYIWNKERIKALNSLLSGLPPTGNENKKAGDGPTHREEAIAYDYRVKAKLATILARGQQREMGGKALERAFDSINVVSTTFIKPKMREVEQAIKLLNEYPTAKKIAENDLDKIKNQL